MKYSLLYFISILSFATLKNCYAQNNISVGILIQSQIKSNKSINNAPNYQLQYQYSRNKFFKPSMLVSSSTLQRIETVNIPNQNSDFSIESQSLNILLGNTSQLFDNFNVMLYLGLQYQFGHSLKVTNNNYSIQNVQIEFFNEKMFIPIINLGVDYQLLKFNKKIRLLATSHLQLSPLDKTQNGSFSFMENNSLWQSNFMTNTNSTFVLIGICLNIKI